MKVKRSLLLVSLAALYTSAGVEAASLVPGSVLTIDAGSKFALGGFTSTYDSSCSNDLGGDVLITGYKGLFVGPNMGRTGEPGHIGSPTGSEIGNVTNHWDFSGAAGSDHMTPDTSGGRTGAFGGDETNGVDMSGWTVDWNVTKNISMGGCQYADPATLNNGGFSGCDQNQDGVDEIINSGTGTLTCGTDCTDGDTYTIVYESNVPVGDPSGFGGVAYDLCLTGTIIGPSNPLIVTDTPPIANDDSYSIGTDTTGNELDIFLNDVEDKLNDAVDRNSVDLDPATPGQQTTFDIAGGGTVTYTSAPAGGVVTYDAPGNGVTGVFTFDYTVDDFRGPNTSNIATVTLVVGNVAPVCNDDNGIADGAFVDLGTSTSVNIAVLANDTDPNPANTLDTATLAVVDAPTKGSAQVETDGTITYTYTDPVPASGVATDSFTYTVSDDDASPLTCTKATVTVVISNTGTSIGGVSNAFLLIDTGNVGADNKVQPALGEGSWFGMELDPGSAKPVTYTPLAGFNHIQLGTTQPALSPDQPNIDSPWVFFGNIGVHQTTSDLNQLSNPGDGTATLDFSGWDVSWNAIPSIPMGNGADNGIAQLTCYSDMIGGIQDDCANADNYYVLNYTATVPPGDASGFGGVTYTLHLEGKISDTAPVLGCADPAASNDVSGAAVIDDCNASSTLSLSPGATASAAGNTTGIGLTPAQVGVTDPQLNPDDGQMCVGGCLDFSVSGIATDHVNIAVKLGAPIPEGAVYRKLVNGKWQDFDISGDDAIGSAPVDSGTGNCPGPDGSYQVGLRKDNQCLFLAIYDGGPNDADGKVNGTIVDPSGILLPGSANVPASSTDGCSLSNASSTVGLLERADWLLVALFIGLLALASRARCHVREDSVLKSGK